MLPLSSRIHVAGHRGMVGSAIVRHLKSLGFSGLLTPGRETLDLVDQAAVNAWYQAESPDIVFLAAAKVGGIHANNVMPADFIRDNLIIQSNVIDAAWRGGVKKLVFLGSSCIYPRLASQPLQEEALLTGRLETTNEWYAVAKIAGIKMCQAYRKQYGFDAISVMPTNLYGPQDNFDLENSHVLPAMLRKFHEAKVSGGDVVTLWGSGTPKREFLHVDDLANALLFLAENYHSGDIINVGVGADISISSLAELVKTVTGFTGRISWDDSKPDGTPRKLMDISKLNQLGWQASIDLDDGMRSTYQWCLQNQAHFLK